MAGRLSRLQNWLFWPPSTEYALPWVVGIVAYAILGALEVPKILGAAAFSEYHGSRAIITIAFAALFLLNASILWLNLIPYYLSWRRTIPPFLGTFVLFSSIYALFWGLVLILRGKAEFGVDDPIYTARCIFEAQGGLLVSIMLVSGFWTLSPGTWPIILERRRAVRYLTLLREKNPLTPKEWDSLLNALKSLQDNGISKLAGLARESDRALLQRWVKAAKTLYEHIHGWPEHKFRNPSGWTDEENIRLRQLQSDKD